MRFLHPHPRILEVRFTNSRSLCDTAYRFSHFYEFSPFKGVYFSRETLDSYYTQMHNSADYWKNRWSGANLPDYVFEPFFEGHFNPITTEEVAVLSEVSKLRNESKFYVIFTAEDALNCREHELAHALWYLSIEYREKAQYLLNRYKSELSSAREKLVSMGYNKEVLQDELHTYCGVFYSQYFGIERIYVPEGLYKGLQNLFSRFIST